MIFITNGTRRINADFVKEIDINDKAENHIFSIKIVDNADNVEVLNVDILRLLKAEFCGTSIKECELKEFAKKIKDKTAEDFEQLNCLETMLEICENKARNFIKEIDLEELVYNNLLELADNFTVPIIFE